MRGGARHHGGGNSGAELTYRVPTSRLSRAGAPDVRAGSSHKESIDDRASARSADARSERTLLTAHSAFLFAASYLAVLLPTLYVKHAHVLSLYKGGLDILLGSAVLHPTRATRALYGLAFFGRDVLEVLLIWILIFAITTRLSARPRAVAIGAAVFGAMLVIGLNAISLTEVQTFLTRDTVAEALAWLWSHPGLLFSYVGPSTLAFLPLAALWAALPAFVAARAGRRPGGRTRAARAVACAIAALVLVSGLAIGTLRLLPSRGAVPMWGYWSATLSSLLQLEPARGEALPPLSRSELEAQFRALTYPLGSAPRPGPLLDLAAPRPRHTIVIALETAPGPYYPILDNPDMPGFYERRSQSIVSSEHYTTRPYTTWAAYSILSGTYPARYRRIGPAADHAAKGLAATFVEHGYSATFIDSFRLDWHEGRAHRSLWTNMGFQTLVETEEPPARERNMYERELDTERRSLSRALEAILEAQRRAAKAFVYVGTIFGHFDWKARPGEESLAASEKIRRNCRALDDVISEFVAALASRGLGRDIILVVTGDHGLRNAAEFVSLGEPMMVGRASFNVPLAIFAPGLIDHEVRLPHATSHIDLAPTLLQMNGLTDQDAFFHGESMLDGRLHDRVLFLLNTGLSPTDGYLWRGRFYTCNALTGVTEIGRDETAPAPIYGASGSEPDAATPDTIRDPRALLARARALFDASARDFGAQRARTRRP